jgi:hypothetical protein
VQSKFKIEDVSNIVDAEVRFRQRFAYIVASVKLCSSFAEAVLSSHGSLKRLNFEFLIIPYELLEDSFVQVFDVRQGLYKLFLKFLNVQQEGVLL